MDRRCAGVIFGGQASEGILIGRGEELAELEALLVDAKSGRGRSVVLIGEPGIGMTTLLSRQIAAADGMLVLQVRGNEAESHMAYSCGSISAGPSSTDSTPSLLITPGRCGVQWH